MIACLSINLFIYPLILISNFFVSHIVNYLSYSFLIYNELPSHMMLGWAGLGWALAGGPIYADRLGRLNAVMLIE